jgi:hypothetical protein
LSLESILNEASDEDEEVEEDYSSDTDSGLLHFVGIQLILYITKKNLALLIT